MESILDAVKVSGMIQKFGGGVGMNFSNIRSKGDSIKSTHGKACGPVSVIKLLAQASQMITQGGVRQGANMAILSVYHKDLLEFLTVKKKEADYLLNEASVVALQRVAEKKWTEVQAEEYKEYCRQSGVYQLFNFSVAVDEDFMYSVQDYVGDKHNSCFDENADYCKRLPCGVMLYEVWDEIVAMAADTGDPGLVFLDRMEEAGRLQSPKKVIATNPCGEQPLSAYASCNLGSINLAAFVRERKPGEEVDVCLKLNALASAIDLAVRFLDDVVSINNHPDPRIAKSNLEERRIGLGPMGLADMLYKLRIPYDSDEALKLSGFMSYFFCTHAHRASERLAEARGRFPLQEGFAPVGKLPEDIWDPKTPRRNAAVTTVAPTGSISIIADCSSGIEPYFAPYFQHNGMKEHGGIGCMWASSTLEHSAVQIAKELGVGLNDVDAIVAEMKNRGLKNANDIDLSYHIKHVAAWQKYIDASVSKTVNLAQSATRDDVSTAYLLAFSSGTKGCTVYRDRSKISQVLEVGKSETTKAPIVSQQNSTPIVNKEERVRARRPYKVSAEIYRKETSEGKLYLTIGFDKDHMPFELFPRVGKTGSTTTGYLDAIGKLASDMFRSGLHPFFVIRALRGIRTMPFGYGKDKVLSVPDAIAQILEEFMAEFHGEKWGEEYGWCPPKNHTEDDDCFDTASPTFEVSVCPQCGNEVTVASGCPICYACGWSKC
jgi:ribonucleoside-diphosphate reductase alpha chain